MTVETSTSQPISIAYPSSPDPELAIEAGISKTSFAAVDQKTWLAGAYTDPSGLMPLDVAESKNGVMIRVKRPLIDIGLPTPVLDLRLGKARSFSLKISAGAGVDSFDLGGIPLRRIELRHGAGDLEIDFSTPNPQRLALIKLSVGAGRAELRRLGNANFEEMEIEGGAGTFRLDFDGEFQRPARVRIKPSIGTLELRIPRLLPAEVTSDGILSRPIADDGFQAEVDRYRTRAAANGRPPMLMIRSSVAMGTLRLISI